MINKIKTEPSLSPFIKERCVENNVEVCVPKDTLNSDYVIIKVDDYYNSLKMDVTPPSPDCLIVLKCKKSGHSLSIVELKSITSASRFTLENLINKFNTCLNDFIKNRFSNLLYIDYKRINLYFVSDIEIYKRDLGLKMEMLINYRFNYMDKKIMIDPFKPTPTIRKCY